MVRYCWNKPVSARKLKDVRDKTVFDGEGVSEILVLLIWRTVKPQPVSRTVGPWMKQEDGSVIRNGKVDRGLRWVPVSSGRGLV